MNSSKNIILVDSDLEEVADFKQALVDITHKEWEVSVCNSNGRRNSKLYNLLRYFKYFTFPFLVFLKRNQINGGTIVAWQQFYGILYAFYCRLFHVKMRNKLVVMTFIYKKKKGFLGRIYHKFIKYSLQGGYIDLLTCTSRAEMTMYSKIFGISEGKFAFVPWGILDYSEETSISELSEEEFIFSSGRSNRDWQFLINSLKDSKYKLKIACDELRTQKIGNVEIYNNIYGSETFSYMKNCYCVVISIKDTNISAGQTVLLQAMNFGKPLIITSSKGLTDDYIINEYNGLVINKDKDELLEALKRLYTDKELYQKLSNNGLNDFYSKYSKYSLGKNVGAAILEQ